MLPQLALIVLGAIGTIAPRRYVDTLKRWLLWPSYENPADLEPRGWIVSLVRLQSIGALLLGLYLVFNSDQELPPIPEHPDLTPGGPDGDSSSTIGTDKE